jgi:hypothetical protein
MRLALSFLAAVVLVGCAERQDVLVIFNDDNAEGFPCPTKERMSGNERVGTGTLLVCDMPETGTGVVWANCRDVTEICNPDFHLSRTEMPLDEFNTRMQYEDGFKAKVKSFEIH